MRYKMLELNVWIQSENNSEPDLILKNGEFVAVKNDEIRSEISQKIFDIDSKGKVIFTSDELKILRLKSTYLVKVQTLNRDENQRSLPMLMLVINYEKNSYTDLNNLIDKTLVNSEYNIDENYKSQILKALKRDLERILKKRAIGIAGLAFLLLILVVIITMNVK